MRRCAGSPWCARSRSSRADRHSWRASSRCAVAEYRGPELTFPDSLPAPAHPVEVLTDPRDAATAPTLAWIRDTGPAEQPLCVVRDGAGEVVAVCHSSRSTPRAAAAGVETAPGWRGRGYGTAAVAAWAAAVRVEGRTPLYGTQWSNLASRRLAAGLGLAMWGESHHLR